MGSGEDQAGLRHKTRHKAGSAGQAHDGMGLFELKLIGWGVLRSDPDVDAIRIRLWKVWRRLSDLDRSWLLEAAGTIAEAEAAKAAWNPKATKEQDHLSRKFAIAAARTAILARLRHPPPWEGEDSRIRTLYEELKGIVEGTVSALATGPVERDTTVQVAAQMLDRTKRRLLARTGHTHFGLLAELVWLASGMRRRISERTVRRYAELPLFSVVSQEKTAQKRKKH